MKTNILWLFFSFFLCVGCEDLEDTYSDYAGDGKIRYLGKCTNIEISPGWQKLYVNWENSTDPNIDKIKVRWGLEGKYDSLLFDAGTVKCIIPNLKNANYEVSVISMDKDGNQSLTYPLFARPYTENHEAILSFTPLISSYYFLRDRLILFFAGWSDQVESAVLRYHCKGDGVDSLVCDRELIEKKYYMLPKEIDTSKPVILERIGRVEGCDDLITFSPYELSKEKIFSSEFKTLIKTKYGFRDISENFVNDLEELEIDYSINSFEDILHFSNLKKLILGKNRFMNENYLTETGSHSQLHEKERSLFALNVANEVCGLIVERYNQHFLPGQTLAFMTEMGNPVLPEINALDSKSWKITCEPEDLNNYDSYLNNLIDKKLNTSWQPEFLPTARSHEITIDMQALNTVHGVKIMQKNFNPQADKQNLYLLPNTIKIKALGKNMEKKELAYVEEYTLGTTPGEITIIYFPNPQDIQYLKFIVNDNSYGNNFSITLSEIEVF